MQVTSAQLRAARAYLGWTMEKVAQACDLHRRTILRLENDERYALAEPASLTKLVAFYRRQYIILEKHGLTLVNRTAEPASASTPIIHLKPTDAEPAV